MSDTPRVLIVDDESALLDLYETWLDDLDAEVVRASCGAEALARCDADIDVVLLDRHMPRVSGDEVLEELRAGAHEFRVAFVSAATPDVEIIDLDIDAYLTKPVTREEYVDLVDSLLRRETVCEAIEQYLSSLSKRAALLESESPSVLRTDPAYVAFEEELARLAERIDGYHLDDPFLRRVFADSGRPDASIALDPTA
ncbi:response regulator transcription factor [Haloplanus aerogenes]|uniref:LytTR family two component transcriptional regulator n=1 Tax=Haloplanus aerogenes TaxID=660522 RepID=A0A3M0CSV2_9EURY|nr:response regulator [Haloplanus aerogenes]AZH26961.1 response regulator [Haloplanus aerogenes]RMB12614.1 LytTR family two component transcriptional regulator [Haloplanus aerogenes]